MNNQEKNSYVRKQILNTLLEMMNEQEFDTIVISALTDKAGVGRASFYRNFTSKEDVLHQEADRLINKWAKEWEELEAAQPNDFFISLLNFYKDYKFRLTLLRPCFLAAFELFHCFLIKKYFTPNPRTFRLTFGNTGAATAANAL